MQFLVLSILLGLALPGINGHQHNHRDLHRHLNGRDAQGNARIETVIDVVTVTKYVLEDGSPASTTPTSTGTTLTTRLAGVFFEQSSISSSKSSLVVATTPVTSSKALSTSIPSSVVPAPTITSTSKAAEAPSVAGERTFTVVNLHTAAVSTIHDDTVGTPTSAGAAIRPGTIAAGATATFAVPRGWIGNIALNDANFPVTTNSTLLEANFVDWSGVPKADFDVSYV